MPPEATFKTAQKPNFDNLPTPTPQCPLYIVVPIFHFWPFCSNGQKHIIRYLSDSICVTNLSVSEIARQALQIFIEQREKEKIEKELEAGYKSYYEYYLKSNEAWKYVDK